MALLLRQSGFSRAVASRKMGCTSASMSNWLNGRTTPSASSLFEFLRVLGYDFRHLQSALESLEKEDGAEPVTGLALDLMSGISRGELLRVLREEARKMLTEAATATGEE